MVITRTFRIPGLLVSAVALAAAAFAQAADPIRWGADREGGAPYIYPLEDNPNEFAGFEVDMAKAISKSIGRPLVFTQKTWAQLPQNLLRGDVDVVFNGYEYTAQHAKTKLPSIPYYIYELSLSVRKDRADITGWDVLKKPAPDGRKWQIGVLEASSADRYAEAQFANTADIRRFEGVTECFLDVSKGRLDASIQDWPISKYYVEDKAMFPDLKSSGELRDPGYYVMYFRPEDTALVDTMNTAIRELHDSGELRRIYERHGIWNETQSKLPVVWKSWPPKHDESLDRKWSILAAQWVPLVKAAGNTVFLAVTAMPLAILIGLVAALARTWHTPALGGTGRLGWGVGRLLNTAATVYIEVIRGTPLLFQIIVIYYVLPDLDKYGLPRIVLPPLWAGVIALAVNYSAYEAEIFRLGLQAIPRGQMEAALALGMSRPLAIRRIVLPQAVRLVIPATANDFIALFKDTAVCSVIAVEELAKQYQMGAKSTGYFLEIAIMASILYLAMSYPLSLLAAWLERRLRKS